MESDAGTSDSTTYYATQIADDRHASVIRFASLETLSLNIWQQRLFSSPRSASCLKGHYCELKPLNSGRAVQLRGNSVWTECFDLNRVAFSNSILLDCFEFQQFMNVTCLANVVRTYSDFVLH